jgi:Protein of unknown function (DUF3467)
MCVCHKLSGVVAGQLFLCLLFNQQSLNKKKITMNNPDQPQEGQLNIELSEEIADGIYSNLAIITHSHSEFIVDFIKVLPGVPKAKVKSRIILTPQHAKRLMKALADNINKYESSHGSIKDTEMPMTLPMNFGGPAAMA